MHNNWNNGSWRDFQAELNRGSRKKGCLSKSVKLLTFLGGAFLVFYFAAPEGLYNLLQFPGRGNQNAGAYHKTDPDQPGEEQLKLPEEGDQLSIEDLQTLVAGSQLVNAKKNILHVPFKDTMVKVETTLDIPLQNYILSKLDRLKPLKRGKPQRIGVLAMEPSSGKILAMAGFDLSDPKANPCTDGDYPAASIFKIITAAAAVETRGYTPNTPLYFNGGKYTLYKRQLKEKKNRYTRKVSFAHAFADSINPVFGKIGSLYLGGETLKKYARLFGFNCPITSELSFEPGTVTITDQKYQWAEVGCGFNKTTTISPLFAAMVTSTIVNSGNRMPPWILEKVTDIHGKTLYEKKDSPATRAVKLETARTVRKLMNKTIETGTASKSFRGFKNDATLSKLSLGGKTGSLYNHSHTVKFDWFTGFGQEKNGSKEIVAAVIVGHRKYIGTRASRYGRMIFKEYFENYFITKNQSPAREG
ncbi:MAG: penicillin-binding transpeptidase domain-containing protein [Desulfobacteraceae bacterium]